MRKNQFHVGVVRNGATLGGWHFQKRSEVDRNRYRNSGICVCRRNRAGRASSTPERTAANCAISEREGFPVPRWDDRGGVGADKAKSRSGTFLRERARAGSRAFFADAHRVCRFAEQFVGAGRDAASWGAARGRAIPEIHEIRCASRHPASVEHAWPSSPARAKRYISSRNSPRQFRQSFPKVGSIEAFTLQPIPEIPEIRWTGRLPASVEHTSLSTPAPDAKRCISSRNSVACPIRSDLPAQISPASTCKTVHICIISRISRRPGRKNSARRRGSAGRVGKYREEWPVP